MAWNDRLAQVRKATGMSQEQVVRAMAQYLPEHETVSLGALSSWESGRTQPRINHALALARVLDSDVDYLFSSELLNGGLNDAGMLKLAEFRSLLLDSPRYRAENTIRKVRTLPVYLQAASAGTGQILDDAAFEEIEVDDSVPSGADFGVRLAGDSMMPRFADGQIVWVKQQSSAENGEIIMCYYDDQSYCKKLSSSENQIQLVSLNKSYEPIIVRPDVEFRIFGVVVG